MRGYARISKCRALAHLRELEEAIREIPGQVRAHVAPTLAPCCSSGRQREASRRRRPQCRIRLLSQDFDITLHQPHLT